MDRRVSKTKKAIQEAYFALLKEDRHRRITISEITRKADVDRKTFYLHYASIDDVIREFAKSKVDELIERVFSLEFPSDQLAIRVFNVFNQMISEYKDILRLLSDSDAYDYFFGQIKSLLIDRILEGNGVDLEGFTRPQIEIYVEYFISGIISSYVRWIRQELPCTIEELAKHVGTVTFGGIQAITGKSI